MKAELIRDDLEARGDIPEHMQEHTETRQVWRNSAMRPVLFWKRGTVIDHPDVHHLVRQGCARPADDECNQVVSRTPEQQDAAEKAYERVQAGILPKDYDLFDAGYISGYLGDGSYKPGPKWDEYQKQQEAAANGAA